MKRSEFDHAIRAAGSILGEPEILVIGSQAIHGSISGDLPAAAERSIEVDVVAFDDEDARKADLIDGSIGEASTFHETFGYYAEGVSETTAVLPDGWRDRLVRYESPMTNGVVAWCLEVHDLWLAKAVAGRPKDLEFCRALGDDGLVSTDTLMDRLGGIPNVAEPVRAAVTALISSASRHQ
jgi:hypothetical protein